MSTISGQYSTVPVYSLYQAGQGSSAAGTSSFVSSQDGTPNSSFSNPVSPSESNQSFQQPGSTGDAQNALSALQASGGGVTDVNNGGSQTSAPATYNDSDSDDSSSTDPSGSFINNQQASADYQSMVLNLGMGNIAAAAKDYAQLQTDLKLHGQHHSGGTVAVDMNSSVDGAAGSVLNVTV